MTAIDQLVKSASVQQYTEAGFTLFDCGNGEQRKAPASTGWQNTPYSRRLDADELVDFYGVILPDTIIVFDYDLRHDLAMMELGDETQLQRLWRELELEPADTLIVKSGSGGYHLYFKKPAEVKVYGKLPGYSAIDIKSGGGYVLAAGSAHYSGNQYIIAHGDPRAIAECPARLLELATRTHDGYGENNIETDDAATRSAYSSYLRSTAPAIQGQQGDRTTFLVAAYGKDLGLPEETVFDLLMDIFNQRCIPEWEPEELRTKVRNAFNYTENSQGYLSPQASFMHVSEIAEYQNATEIIIESTASAEPNTFHEEYARSVNAQIHWTRTPDRANPSLFTYDPTINNVVGFFRLVPHHGNPNPLYKLLRYNRFSKNIEFTRPAFWHDPDQTIKHLQDIDILQIKNWLASTKGLRVSTELIREGAMIIAQDNAYHPVRDWLNGLVWDGVPRLDTWLPKYLGTQDTEYSREIGKNTLIGAVARIMAPGCQNDTMLILEGPQNAGKTSVCRILGGEWFADPKIEPGAKDTIVRIQGKWICEMSEMEVLRRSEISAFKRFLTVVIDTERLPYEHLAQDLPRQCIFIGTINPNGAGYLQDQTGNRRFLPITVGSINLAELSTDREQLFSEAVSRYHAGEQWHITNHRVLAVAATEQMTRQQTDLWAEIIIEWADNNPIPEPLTTRDIAWQVLNLPPNRVGKNEANRICEALRNAGFIRRRMRHEQLQIWSWTRHDPTEGLI